MRFISNTNTRWVSALSCFLISSFSSGQSIHISHCFSACPLVDAENQIVVRHLYASEINRQTGVADWVAYRILPGTIGIASLLPRYWKADELLPESGHFEVGSSTLAIEQPDLSEAQDRDYRVNEFVLNSDDRGRLAPMTSFADTPYWDDLNYTSNMASLPSDLRLGAWSRLDQAINELSSSESTIYVVSGPIYRTESFNSEKLFEEAPERYFKIVATPESYASFAFDAKLPIHATYCSQLETIGAIQELTGFEIFPNLATSLTPGLFASLGCGQQYRNLKNEDE